MNDVGLCGREIDWYDTTSKHRAVLVAAFAEHATEVPKWCDHLVVRPASRDVELLGGWGAMPLVLVPDQAARTIVCLVRAREFDAAPANVPKAIGFWLTLDTFRHPSPHAR